MAVLDSVSSHLLLKLSVMKISYGSVARMRSNLPCYHQCVSNVITRTFLFEACDKMRLVPGPIYFVLFINVIANILRYYLNSLTDKPIGNPLYPWNYQPVKIFSLHLTNNKG